MNTAGANGGSSAAGPPNPPSQLDTASTASSQLNVQQVGNLIRHWVHYDTTLQTLNKQAKQVRDAKNMTEDQILYMFQAAHMTQPVIQIVGGRIVMSKERHTPPLTFKNLEIYLHQYYRSRPGSKDETADILKFIKSQRDVTETPCLKKIMTGSEGGNGPKG